MEDCFFDGTAQKHPFFRRDYGSLKKLTLFILLGIDASGTLEVTAEISAILAEHFREIPWVIVQLYKLLCSRVFSSNSR